MNGKPLVSIGMPVYNGERFIRKSLDSILEQDYENLELIISDNCSTDATAEICQEYLRKDERIQYHRNAANLGAVVNFSRVFELSRGKYFMWAGDHDLWHPTFTSRCVAILEEDPEVALVYSKTKYVDEDDNILHSESASDEMDTRGLSAVERYKKIIWKLEHCDMTYGMLRKETLLQVNLGRFIWSPDFLFLAELSLKGTFAYIPETLFYCRRNHPPEDDEATKERRAEAILPSGNSKWDKVDYAQLYHELRNAHLQVVTSSTLSPQEKVRAYLETMACFESRFHVKYPGFFIRRLPHRTRKLISKAFNS